jgi:hypothetical protein
VTFLDKAGAQAAPASVRYRIDDVTGAAPVEVRGDTSLAPGASVEITLTPADHAILDAANAQERRLVTVTASYGANDAVVAEYEYRVRNLAKA